MGSRSFYLPISDPRIPIQWGEDTHFFLACWSAHESVATEEVQAEAHHVLHSLLACCWLPFDFGQLVCSQKMPGHSLGGRTLQGLSTVNNTWGVSGLGGEGSFAVWIHPVPCHMLPGPENSCWPIVLVNLDIVWKTQQPWNPVQFRQYSSPIQISTPSSYDTGDLPMKERNKKWGKKPYRG